MNSVSCFGHYMKFMYPVMNMMQSAAGSHTAKELDNFCDKRLNPVSWGLRANWTVSSFKCCTERFVLATVCTTVELCITITFFCDVSNMGEGLMRAAG